MGLGLSIKGKECAFSYHSADLFYCISSKEENHKIFLDSRLYADPENEVYGWVDSIDYAQKAWIKKIKTGVAVEMLGTFSQAIKAQTFFCKALNVFYKNSALT